MLKKAVLFLCAAVVIHFAAADPAMAQQGNSWCRADKPPRVQVKTSTDVVNWDFSKSEKQLNSFKIDTINPYGNNVITDVGGLMQGGIEMQEKMQFNTLTHNRLKQVCYWYDTVLVSLHIRPTIYIAREFPPGSCKHNAIKMHELKHINVDREIVNKYADLVGQAVKQEIDRQTVYGPYPVSQSAAVEATMKSRLERILIDYSNRMDKERKQRQQAIDNLSEYQQVNAMCSR